MLKKRDLHECHALYSLLNDPSVSPYVRYQCHSPEEYLFLTKQLMDEEEQKTTISRTILNEAGLPIGTIDLYHIVNHTGFLATWIGAPYFGNGYSQRAKSVFLSELFLEHAIETVFLKIRKQNIRSSKAAQKLSYVKLANDSHDELYGFINAGEQIYDLYCVERIDFIKYSMILNQGVAT